MGNALYRSYRSQSFDEIIGQDHIIQVLKNTLTSNKISHAYLLTGPRGVGKTSVARILAYAVNDIEYSEGGSHLDIIEIDAASNRRIDEVREIRERVMIAPTSGKYKVYIIDEVHMLTREAFNALLKTLEEPPEHAIFILATTELHKVPETIISRCIRLTFHPIPAPTIVKHLKAIAKQEKIKINDDALAVLAEHADGGFRDAITLLEQVSHQSSEVTRSDVEAMLGLAGHEHVEAIMQLLSSGSIQDMETALAAVRERGGDDVLLAAQLLDGVRLAMMSQPQNSKSLLSLQRSLLEVAGSTRPKVQLELALFGYMIKDMPEATATVRVAETPVQPEAVPEPAAIKPEPMSAATPKPNAEPLPAPAPTQKPAVAQTKPLTTHAGACWPEVLDAVRQKNNTLYAIARMAEVEETDEYVALIFTFPFHYKQMQEAKNKAVFSSVLASVGDKKKRLEVRMAEVEKATLPSSSTKPGANLDSVSNIFGSHEVLES